MKPKLHHPEMDAPELEGLEARLLLSASCPSPALVDVGLPADAPAVPAEADPSPSAAEAVLDIQPPTIEAWFSAAQHGNGVGRVLLPIPDDGTFSEPRAHSVMIWLVIDFSEVIDPASFTPAGVRIAGHDAEGRPVDLSEIAIATHLAEGETTGTIHFGPALPDVVRYRVAIEGVQDVAGNPLAGDNDRIFTALAGDANGDLRVNAVDLSYIWAHRVAEIDGVSPAQTRSDITADGRVNAIDLSAAWAARGVDMRSVSDPALPAPSGGSPEAVLGGADDGAAIESVPAALGPVEAGVILPALPGTSGPIDVLAAAPGESDVLRAEGPGDAAADLQSDLDVLGTAALAIPLGG